MLKSDTFENSSRCGSSEQDTASTVPSEERPETTQTASQISQASQAPQKPFKGKRGRPKGSATNKNKKQKQNPSSKSETTASVDFIDSEINKLTKGKPRRLIQNSDGELTEEESSEEAAPEKKRLNFRPRRKWTPKPPRSNNHLVSQKLLEEYQQSQGTVDALKEKLRELRSSTLSSTDSSQTWTGYGTTEQPEDSPRRRGKKLLEYWVVKGSVPKEPSLDSTLSSPRVEPQMCPEKQKTQPTSDSETLSTIHAKSIRRSKIGPNSGGSSSLENNQRKPEELASQSFPAGSVRLLTLDPTQMNASDGCLERDQCNPCDQLSDLQKYLEKLDSSLHTVNCLKESSPSKEGASSLVTQWLNHRVPEASSRQFQEPMSSTKILPECSQSQSQIPQFPCPVTPNSHDPSPCSQNCPTSPKLLLTPPSTPNQNSPSSSPPHPPSVPQPPSGPLAPPLIKEPSKSSQPEIPLLHQSIKSCRLRFQFPEYNTRRWAIWAHLVLLLLWPFLLIVLPVVRILILVQKISIAQIFTFMAVASLSKAHLIGLLLLQSIVVVVAILCRVRNGVNLYSSRRFHVYCVPDLKAYEDWIEGGDLRADVISLGKLKHLNPLRVKCFYSVQAKYGFQWYWTERRKADLEVSLELICQISTSVNLSLSSEEKLVWQRIEQFANHYQNINLDRYEILENKYVVQDSCLVAYGLWRWLLYERRHALFPRSQ